MSAEDIAAWQDAMKTAGLSQSCIEYVTAKATE